MFKEILTEEQIELLDFLKSFKRNFYLVGGTAIALQIGHRRSIDFDLFSDKPLDLRKISDKFYEEKIRINKVFVRTKEQFTLNSNSVQITFFYYPYNIPYEIIFEAYFKMPSLLELGAMKAFALGKRAKWKDYVDLYYIAKHYHSLRKIMKRASQLFGEEFSEKMFRGQISYFDDIDYSEEVVYLGDPIPQEEVKSFLINAATEKF